jgi:hypothetical protein
MSTAIRSMHRPPATPITRFTAALPDLPHPHTRQQRRVGATAIARAVAALMVVLVGAVAVRSRHNVSPTVTPDHGGENHAPDAAKE